MFEKSFNQQLGTNKKNSKDEEIRELLNQKKQELAKTTDGLGRYLDDGIENVIASLNVAGFPTSMSCFGHCGELNEKGIARRYSYPYVDIKATGEPEERFYNEIKIPKKKDNYG